MVTRKDNKIEEYQLQDTDYFIFTDQFGRKFRLDPIKNEFIEFPFVITPLFKRRKD